MSDDPPPTENGPDKGINGSAELVSDSSPENSLPDIEEIPTGTAATFAPLGTGPTYGNNGSAFPSFGNVPITLPPSPPAATDMPTESTSAQDSERSSGSSSSTLRGISAAVALSLSSGDSNHYTNNSSGHLFGLTGGSYSFMHTLKDMTLSADKDDVKAADDLSIVGEISGDILSTDIQQKSSKSSGSSETSLPSTEDISEGDFSPPEDKESPKPNFPDDGGALDDPKGKLPFESGVLELPNKPQSCVISETLDITSKFHEFEDSDDSCSMNVDKYRAILESLSEMNKPPTVEIGKKIKKRRKRRLSGILSPDEKSNSSEHENSKQAKRHQRDPFAETMLPLSPLPTSSESSRDTVAPHETVDPTANLTPGTKSPETICSVQEAVSSQTKEETSRDAWSNTELTSCVEVSPQTERSAKSIHKSASDDSDNTLHYEVPEEQSRPVVITLRSSDSSAQTLEEVQLSSTAIQSFPPSRFPSDSLALRINNITGMIDQIVALDNLMAATPPTSVPGPPPRRLSREEMMPIPGPSNRPTLRELEEDFLRGFHALNSGVVADEEEATQTFRKSVREMRDHLRQEASANARPGEIVPASDEPTTLEEIRHALPVLWQTARRNNRLLKQWGSTALDWCLQTIPESNPDQLYDCDSALESIYGNIQDVSRSVARLMNRWRQRRMDFAELGDLTYLMTLASNASTLYNTLRAQVLDLMYTLGTLRRTERRRHRTRSNEKANVASKYKKGRK